MAIANAVLAPVSSRPIAAILGSARQRRPGPGAGVRARRGSGRRRRGRRHAGQRVVVGGGAEEHEREADAERGQQRELERLAGVDCLAAGSRMASTTPVSAATMPIHCSAPGRSPSSRRRRAPGRSRWWRRSARRRSSSRAPARGRSRGSRRRRTRRRSRPAAARPRRRRGRQDQRASATSPTAWPTNATIAAGCARLARPREEVRGAPQQRGEQRQRRADHVLAAAAAAR